MTIEVFWGSGSAYSWRVLLALELKGLRYESHLLDLAKQEHKSPELLKLNPRGRVPVLRDGDYVCRESLAILLYLDRQYPQVPLFGVTPAEAGDVMRVICEYLLHAETPLNQIVSAVFLEQVEARSEQVQRALEIVVTEAKRLEQRLSEAHWLATQDVSAADLVLFPAVKVLQRALTRREAEVLRTPFESMESDLPGIAAWLRRIEALPGYERTYPPHWRA